MRDYLVTRNKNPFIDENYEILHKINNGQQHSPHNNTYTLYLLSH